MATSMTSLSKEGAAEEHEEFRRVVERALGERPQSERWTVSCRRVESLWPLWSVSIESPDRQFRRRFVGPVDRLGQTIRAALRRAGF
jgi:hypothetical protein